MNEQQEKGTSVQEVEEKLRAEGAEMANKATQTWDAVKEKASDLRESAEAGVRENPLPMLAGALLTGLTVGILLRALELRNEELRLTMPRRFLSRWGAGLAASLGFLAGRARSSGVRPVETVKEMASKVSSRGSRLGRPFRNAWRRFSR